MSWSTSELRVRLASYTRFKPSSIIFYWPFQGGNSFVDLLCFICLVLVMPLCSSVYLCLVVTCWERADLLTLVCCVQLWVCHFPIGNLGQVWYLIVSIPDLCTLSYFHSSPFGIGRSINTVPYVYKTRPQYETDNLNLTCFLQWWKEKQMFIKWFVVHSI